MWLVITVGILTAAYLFLGYIGNKRIYRVRAELKPPKKPPLVSIIIPTYRSEKTIEATLKSIKRLKYPRIEIVVVNEYQDRTPQIARRYGAKVFHHNKRTGKPSSLNFAMKKAKGEILFFLDSDTSLLSDTLDKIIPWFSRKDISAVMPKYLVKNPQSDLARLAGIENAFTFALLRMNMFFGSLIGFRGCGIAIRKSVMRKLGGWPNTLLEDNHLAASIAKRGMKIQWEPQAIIKTSESTTRKALRNQKIRWGKGSFFTYAHHKRFYMTSPQFLLFFIPYFILSLFMIDTLFIGTVMSLIYDLPRFFAFVIYQILLAFLAMLLHVVIMVWSSGDRRDPLEIFEFVFFYFPLVTVYYFRGLVKGIKKKKRKEPELDFRQWER
jgi:cellulose synthase/poly-beta-1,6-N-acetylglucosamine synthase-like glycosyltransferase